MPHRQPGPTTNSAVNKRRYSRKAVVQEALFNASGLAGIRCEIRDFCQGGVFLKLDGGAQAMERLPIAPGAYAEIRFTPKDGKTPIHLTGRIAHVSSSGLGVAFSEPPPAAALRALEERSQTFGPSPRAPDGAGGGTSDARVHAICRQALEGWLPGVLEDFFGQIAPSLMDASDKAQTNAEQTAYFEAIAQLKAKRAEIETRYRARVLARAGSFSAPASTLSTPAPDTAGLSLVDKSEFEDWLSLNAAIAKVESVHEAELRSIEQHLAELAEREVSSKNNPCGPGVLGHAFRATFDELQLPNAAKRVVYSVFAQALNARLGDLCQRMGESIGALVPHVRPQPTSRRARPAPERVKVEADQSPPKASDPPAARAEAPDVFHTAEVLWELCAQVGGAGRRVSSSAKAAAPPAVLAALEQLQAAKTARNVDYLDTQALESQLALALSGPDHAGGALAGGHKQTLHVLGAMLDNVINDNAVAPGVKPYFQKLQIPLLQAAVADPSFLHAEENPAREVLNLLDQLSIAGNEKGEIENKMLRQALDVITDGILKGAPTSPAAFERARLQLEKLAAPLLRARTVRMDRVREACEGGHRIKNARSVVDREINRRLGGGVVPTVVPELLDSGWRQLLVLTLLREGSESRAWSRQMGIVDKLLGWLAKDRPESPPTSLEAHLLIDFVDEHLLAVCPDQTALNHVVEHLTALLVGVGSPREKRPPEFVSIPAVEQEIRPGKDAHLKQFRVGDWLKFSLTPGSETPLRLTWVGQSPARYVFVNHKGGKELELSPEEFSRYLIDRRAVRTESLDLPLMERTATALMQSMQDKLKYQAIHDPLTGLINRKEFMRRLDRHFALEESRESGHLVCLMEIDQLRIINSLCGMEAGDRLLKEVSVIMVHWLKEGDILARLGDHNFGLLIPRCDREEGQARLESLRDTLRQYHFETRQRSFPLGVSMGLVAGVPGWTDVNALLNNADAACLAAQQKGRNLIQFYDEGDASLEQQKNLMDWVGRIDRILAENRLFVRCQLIAPIFPENGLQPHHEILLGIRDEQGGLVSPAEFVTAAERWKRMSEIDIWQIRSVFRWLGEHRERFRQIGGFSINLSGQSLNSDDFLAFLHQHLSAENVPAEKITFEITETAAIDEFSRAEKFIRQIKRYGCKFSLDDFGSGFSSYAYLKNLQVDYLKIDGSFVKDLASSSTDYALVKSMNEIGHSLGMRTIAEYVENDEILDKLKEIGVDYAQGYGIRRPVLIDELL